MRKPIILVAVLSIFSATLSSADIGKIFGEMTTKIEGFSKATQIEIETLLPLSEAKGKAGELAASKMLLTDHANLTATNKAVTEGLTKCNEAYSTHGAASISAMAPVVSALAQNEAASTQKSSGVKIDVANKIKKHSASDLSKIGKDAYGNAASALAPAQTLCVSGMKVCEGITAQSAEGSAIASKIATHCNATFKELLAKINAEQASAESLRSSATKTMDMIKWGAGIGAAAVVGGIVYKNKQDDKEAEEKKKKLEKEFEEGIARKEDGTKTNCLTAATYNNPECKPVLLNYCAKDENNAKGGCVAFADKMCQADGAPVAFCIGKESRDYCKVEGPYTAESPACIWTSSQPKSCLVNPDNIACLTTQTPDQLMAACAKYPYDPLCKAHQAGKVVTQPLGEGAAAVASAGYNNGQDAEGLNDLIGSRKPSSILGESVWRSNSSAYKNLCAQKKLRGCN